LLNAIETRGLRREFAGGIVAVQGVDLEVKEGEVFGFLGPNGAGKTTTVRMLTTLLRPTSGHASVAGFDVYTQQHQIRRSIGVALQEAGLDALASARELLELQAKLCGLSAQDARRRASEMIDLVGLSEAAERRVKTYSGGMKRRLDLASALIHEPRLLFLDEPTEGLDPASRRAVWQEVERLNRQMGLTVFLTTHYMEEADQLTDRLAIIDHGQIVAEGTPSSLKAAIGTDIVTVSVEEGQAGAAKNLLDKLDGLREIREDAAGLTLFVENGGMTVAHAMRLLDSAQVAVGTVSVSQPTLDEVFLRATGSRLEGAGTTSEVNNGSNN
jgi:ABC-2 type transport system ATP-binding protein